MITDWSDKITAVCNGSSLVIGIGSEKRIIPSNTSAIIDHAKNIIHMQDGEAAIIKIYKYFPLL